MTPEKPEHSHETLRQVVEVAGDPEYQDGWIFLPLHLLDGKTGNIEHVVIFFDPECGLNISSAVLWALHTALSDEELEVQRLRRKRDGRVFG